MPAASTSPVQAAAEVLLIDANTGLAFGRISDIPSGTIHVDKTSDGWLLFAREFAAVAHGEARTPDAAGVDAATLATVAICKYMCFCGRVCESMFVCVLCVTRHQFGAPHNYGGSRDR